MHQRAWNHFCWLNEDSFNTIYSNGNLVATFKNTNVESQYLFEDPEDVFDSALVIGQDQGTIRGGFSIRKLFQGKATELNIWNRILPEKDILSMSECKQFPKGNVVSWNKEIF